MTGSRITQSPNLASVAPPAGASETVASVPPVFKPAMASEEWSRSAPGQPQPKAPTGGDSVERHATNSPVLASETRGGAGDDCSVGKRGAWPPLGGASSSRIRTSGIPDVTAGETAINSVNTAVTSVLAPEEKVSGKTTNRELLAPRLCRESGGVAPTAQMTQADGRKRAEVQGSATSAEEGARPSTNSVVADDCRGAPALAGASSLDSVGPTSVGSALSFIGERCCDFGETLTPSQVERFKLASRSDCIGTVDITIDLLCAALERAWLLQPGANDLPRTLPFVSKNTSTFRVAADNVIQFASSSSSLIPNT